MYYVWQKMAALELICWKGEVSLCTLYMWTKGMYLQVGFYDITSLTLTQSPLGVRVTGGMVLNTTWIYFRQIWIIFIRRNLRFANFQSSFTIQIYNRVIFYWFNFTFILFLCSNKLHFIRFWVLYYCISS